MRVSLNFNMYKKAISPVVAVSLLLVVAVISIVGFQSWFNTFSTSTLSGVESQGSGDVIATGAKTVVGGQLYFNNGYNGALEVTRVTIGGQDCNFTGSISSGLQNLTLSNNCTNGLSSAVSEIVVYTNKGIFSSKMKVGSVSGSSSNSNNDPSLSLTSNLTEVNYNESILLSWSASNVDNCTASGDWTGDKNLTDTLVVSNIQSNKSYILTCFNSETNVSYNLNISVNISYVILETYNGALRWSDGTNGSTCLDYVNNNSGYNFVGAPGDDESDNGAYWIDPIGSSPFKIFCNMVYDGGGWTMMANNKIGTTYDWNDNFWYGTRGSNVDFVHFDGVTYNSGDLETVIANIPMTQIISYYNPTENVTPWFSINFSTSSTFATKRTAQTAPDTSEVWMQSNTGAWTYTAGMLAYPYACGDTCRRGLTVYSSYAGDPNGPCDHVTSDTGENTCNKWWQVATAGHRGGSADTRSYALLR